MTNSLYFNATRVFKNTNQSFKNITNSPVYEIYYLDDTVLSKVPLGRLYSSI